MGVKYTTAPKALELTPKDSQPDNSTDYTSVQPPRVKYGTDGSTSVRLLGDTVKAADWIQWAYKQLGELRKQVHNYLHRSFAPAPGILVNVYVQGDRNRIVIFAEGDELLYEFVASDFVYVNLDSGGAPVTPGDFPYIAGYAIQTRLPANSSFDEGFVYKLDTNQRFAARSVIEPSHALMQLYCNQKRMGGTWYSRGGRICFSNLSMMRYGRAPAARLYGSTITSFSLPPRDFGINIVPTQFKDGKLLRNGKTGMAPDAAAAFADPGATDRQILASDGTELRKPRLEYAQTACVVTVGGQDFFLHVSATGKKIYAYSAEHSWPLAPTQEVSATIPYPAWADPEQPGIGDFNDGLQFMFDQTGTKMCAVLFKHEASYDSVGHRMARFADLSGGIVQDTPVVGTWDQIYADPKVNSFAPDPDTGTYAIPLNKVTPGLCEWSIEPQINDSGVLTGITVTLIRQDLGSDPLVNTYFAAADYDITTNKLVVSKLETWLLDGSLFTFAFGPTYDPDNINTYAHCELAIGLYTSPVDITPAAFVEKTRMLMLRGRIACTSFSTADYFAETFDLFDSFNSLGGPTADKGSFIVQNVIVDLRACAWLAIAQAFYNNAGPGDTACGAYVYSFHGKPTRYKYAFNNGTANDPTPTVQPELVFVWPQTERPAAGSKPAVVDPVYPGRMLPVSPFNYISQYLLGRLTGGLNLFLSEWAVHKTLHAVAVATRVVRFPAGLDTTGDHGRNALYVALWLDLVEGRGFKTTHEKLYRKAQEAVVVNPPPGNTPPMPMRDWSFYYVEKPVMTADEFFGIGGFNGDPADPWSLTWPAKANAGTFRVAGVFFQGGQSEYQKLLRSRQP